MKLRSVIVLTVVVILIASCASRPYHTKGRFRTPVSTRKGCGCMIDKSRTADSSYLAANHYLNLYKSGN